MRHRLAALAAVAALAALAAPGTLGCTRRATQLIVVVETDLVAGVDYDCFGILVSRLDAEGAREDGATRRFLMVPADAAAPFSFGVTPPDGDARRRVEVAVEALDGCSDPGPMDRVVRRAVRTGFLPEQSLRVPLFLPLSCGDGCIESESCPAVGPDCVPIPVVEPTELAPATPGEELVDAATALDAGIEREDAPGVDAPAPAPDSALVVDAAAPADAGLPPGCTTVTATNFGGLSLPGPFVVLPRVASVGWRAFWDTGGSTAVLDDPGGSSRLVVTTMPPGASTERLVPFGAVHTTGDDIQLFGTVQGQSRVLRWWGPSYDTPLEVLTSGPLQAVAPAALPTGEILVVVDEGAGARNVLWRLPALSGTPLSLGPIATDAQSVVLSPRIGGAVAAVAGSPGACTVIALAGDGSPTTPITVPVVGLCAQVSVVALDDRNVVLAHVSGRDASEQAAYQLIDTTARTVSEPVVLGRALPSRIIVLPDTAIRGFRVVWQDPAALSSLAVPDGARPGTRHCIEDAPGATTTDYGSFRSASRGDTIDVMFVGGTRGSLVHVELSGP